MSEVGWLPLLVFVGVFLALLLALWRSIWPGASRSSGVSRRWSVAFQPIVAAAAVLVSTILFLGSTMDSRADRRIAAFTNEHKQYVEQLQLEHHKHLERDLGYRRLALGGLRESVQMIGGMLDGRIPASDEQLWRASIAGKAYLYETDAANTEHIVNEGWDALQWDEESWIDGPRRFTVLRLLLRKRTENPQSVTLNVDMGIEGTSERETANQVTLRFGVPGSLLSERTARPKAVHATIEPEVSISDETLFWMEFEPTERDVGECPSGLREVEGASCVEVEVTIENEYEKGSYSLYVPDIARFDGPIGVLKVRHHFSREPEKVAELSTYIEWDSMVIDHTPQPLENWSSDCQTRPLPDHLELPDWWQFGAGYLYCASFEELTRESWPVFAYRQAAPARVAGAGSDRARSPAS